MQPFADEELTAAANFTWLGNEDGTTKSVALGEGEDLLVLWRADAG